MTESIKLIFLESRISNGSLESLKIVLPEASGDVCGVAERGKYLCCPLPNTDEKNVKMNRMLGPLFHAWFFHKGLEQNRTMLPFVDRLHHRMPDK